MTTCAPAHANSFGVTHTHGPGSSALPWFRCLALVVARFQRMPTVSVCCLGAGLTPAHPNSFGDASTVASASAPSNSFGVTHTHGPGFSALPWFRCLAVVVPHLQRIPTVSVWWAGWPVLQRLPTVLVPCLGDGLPSAHAHGFGALHWCWPSSSACQQFR